MERRTRYRRISNSPYIEYHAIDPNGREDAFISILQYPTRCKMQLVGCKSDGFDRFRRNFLTIGILVRTLVRVEWDLFGSFQ